MAHAVAGSGSVCVMDASTQLGSSLVERLLRRGYTVHAAVQGHGDGHHLVSSNRAAYENKKLKIFQSDPFDYHSIIDALKGCCGLFYSFQPPLDHPIYDEWMAEVEVRAAHNVLEACAQIDTIDKVVFTSSATAVIWTSANQKELDERNWSDINFCRKFKLWHGLSKTLAEKFAWGLAMDRGISMVTINAGLIMHPDLLSITNPYLKGAAEMYKNGVFVTVDLDFLVDAHICVYENVSSYGRYLCFNHVINQTQDVLHLAKLLTSSTTTTTPSSSSSSSPVAAANNSSSSQSHQWSYGEDETRMRIIEQRISNKKLNKLMVDFDSESEKTQL